MKVFQFTMAYVLVFLIIVSVLGMAGLGRAVGTIEGGFYGERTEIDLNETDEPLIFHGWLNYTGISVLPLKVYVSASANLGQPVLTESEFVFHVPANETYEVYIYVDNIEGNRTTGRLTLYVYWEQGPTSGSGGEAQGIYLVRNSSREEQLVKVYGISPQNNDVQAIVYLGFFSFLIIIYTAIRRRLSNPKRIPSRKG